MEYSGIIFDFNGVLLWDTPLHDEAWQRFSLRLRGRVLTPDEMRQAVHGRTNAAILAYLTGQQLSVSAQRHLAHEKETLYQQLCLEWGPDFRLSPGAIELLNYLAAHDIPHAIATSSGAMNVEFYLEWLHLDTWFDAHKIVYDDGTLAGKPAPDCYQRAAARLGLPPETCVVVEDAPSGILAAQQAGIGRIYALGAAENQAALREIPGVHDVIEHLGLLPKEIFREKTAL